MKIRYKFELFVETDLPSVSELSTDELEKGIEDELESINTNSMGKVAFSKVEITYVPPIGFL